jgi:hypothetical protein
MNNVTIRGQYNQFTAQNARKIGILEWWNIGMLESFPHSRITEFAHFSSQFEHSRISAILFPIPAFTHSRIRVIF